MDSVQVLVARGDALPTSFASSSLGLNPQLPFLGTSAYAPAGKEDSAVAKRYTGLRSKRGARLQSLAVEDPSTQFCADEADCLRNQEYFMQVSIFV